MDFQAALRARFLGDSGITGLVGQRVYWVERPQASALPAITLQMVSDVRDQHLKGWASLQPARVQIDVWAAKYADGRAITEAILAAIVPPTTANGHIFARAIVDLAPRDLSEQGTATDGKDKTIFRVSMDLIFNHASA